MDAHSFRTQSRFEFVRILRVARSRIIRIVLCLTVVFTSNNFNMCVRRIKKIRKGSQAIREREARRLHRLRQLSAQPAQPVRLVIACPPTSPEKNAQCRLIMDLAWKTIALVQRHNFIQQRITALRKETSEFVAAIMNNPENKRRYCENVRLHQLSLQAKVMDYQDDNSQKE